VLRLTCKQLRDHAGMSVVVHCDQSLGEAARTAPCGC
jgi:hypothetical protein